MKIATLIIFPVRMFGRGLGPQRSKLAPVASQFLPRARWIPELTRALAQLSVMLRPPAVKILAQHIVLLGTSEWDH